MESFGGDVASLHMMVVVHSAGCHSYQVFTVTVKSPVKVTVATVGSFKFVHSGIMFPRECFMFDYVTLHIC